MRGEDARRSQRCDHARVPMRFRRSLCAIVTLAAVVCATPAGAQSAVAVMGIPSEIGPVEQRLQDSRLVTVRGHVFRVGTMNGTRVAVGRTGAGKVNSTIVATLLIGEFAPAALFFSGTAGAVDQALAPGDVVIGARVAQHDTGAVTSEGLRRRGLRNAQTGELDSILLSAPESLLTAARLAVANLSLPPIASDTGAARTPRIVEGVIVTGDVFVSDVARRDELRSSLGASAVEMEGAAVDRTCRQFSVPCLIVRGITDRADGQASGSYDSFRARASEHAAVVVAAIIAKLNAPAR